MKYQTVLLITILLWPPWWWSGVVENSTKRCGDSGVAISKMVHVHHSNGLQKGQGYQPKQMITTIVNREI